MAEISFKSAGTKVTDPYLTVNSVIEVPPLGIKNTFSCRKGKVRSI